MKRLGHWAAASGGLLMAMSLLVPPVQAAGQTLTMEATAYGPSAADNYPYGPTDYFGQPLVAGDIAVDPSVIPLRTCLYVTGYQSPNLPAGGFIGEADDEGGAIKGMHVDLFMNANPTAVSNFGIQTVHVTILGPAQSTSLSGTAACASYASTIGHGGTSGTGGSGGTGSTSGSSGTGGSGSTSQSAPVAQNTPNGAGATNPTGSSKPQSNAITGPASGSRVGHGSDADHWTRRGFEDGFWWRMPGWHPILVGLLPGMSGRHIYTLQADLELLGYSSVQMTGLYDTATQAAVTTFETQHGLPTGGATTMAFRNDILKALRTGTGNTGAPASPTTGSTTSVTTTSSTPPTGGSSPSATSPMVLGYYVPGPAAWADLQAHANQITAIAPFWYSFTQAGTLRDMGSSSTVMAFANAHHIAVYPMVINGYGNNTMWQSSAQLQQDVAALASVAQRNNYAGFNIDFESLNNPDETGLTTFVQDLAAALHKEGKKVIVSVGPRTSANNGYHVYNYAALGQAADYVDLMLYDAHDNGGPAGPVAPMNWVTSIVKYAESTIAPGKILIGLAGYGYNWAADGSTEISDAQALALQARYGSTFVGNGIDEARITYTDASGYAHTVWFEDSTSEAYKVAFVSSGHLGGVALWDLGEEDAGVWPMLASHL
jgi:spore germination protein